MKTKVWKLKKVTIIILYLFCIEICHRRKWRTPSKTEFLCICTIDKNCKEIYHGYEFSLHFCYVYISMCWHKLNCFLTQRARFHVMDTNVSWVVKFPLRGFMLQVLIIWSKRANFSFLKPKIRGLYSKAVNIKERVMMAQAC